MGAKGEVSAGAPELSLGALLNTRLPSAMSTAKNTTAVTTTISGGSLVVPRIRPGAKKTIAALAATAAMPAATKAKTSSSVSHTPCD